MLVALADLAGRRDDAGEHHADQQDQADVLDRPLPALPRISAACARPINSYIRASSNPVPGTMRGTVGSLGARPCNGSTRICDDSVPNLCQNVAHGPSGAGAPMRVLVVTNMYPSRERPCARAVRARSGRGAPAARRPRGRAVRVRARAAGARAARRVDLRPRYRGQRFDIVHAHFGLTAWPALLARLGPGRRDAARQRPARAPLVRRDARGAAVHGADRGRLARVQREPARARATKRRVAVLPVGIDLTRFRPIPRARGARAARARPRPARTCCSRTTRRGR